MPRVGGVYTIPNVFTPNTIISSSAMNANFADVATALTGSLATDGSSFMSGQLKAADGPSDALPGLSFNSDPDTGWRRVSSNVMRAIAGGNARIDVTASGVEIPVLTVGGVPVSGTLLPAGVKMPFYNTAVPTGWVKDTTPDNAAIRIVNGTGGAWVPRLDFTLVMQSRLPSGTVDAHTLALTESPSHFHGPGGTYYVGTLQFSGAPGGANTAIVSSTVSWVTDSKGGGGSHTHGLTMSGMDFSVSYVDMIIGEKS